MAQGCDEMGAMKCAPCSHELNLDSHLLFEKNERDSQYSGPR